MTKKDLLHNLGVASGALHNILADCGCVDEGILKKMLEARALVVGLRDMVEEEVTDEAFEKTASVEKANAEREAFEVWKAKYYEERRTRQGALANLIFARLEAREGAVAE